MPGLRLTCAVVLVAATGVCASLSGCGASPAAPVATPAAPSAAALGGNWLITGALPFTNPVGPVSNGSFGLAITFAVTGNNLIAATSENLVCAGLASSGSGALATGTAASGGSFTLAAVTGASGPTLQMSATAPVAGATTFAGTYSYSTTGPCATTQSSSFTATKIADVTGTYTGTASFTGLTGSSFTGAQVASLIVTLQQGAALAGSTTTDQEVLTGTISVKGLPCITTGTAALPTGTTTTTLTPTGVSGVLGSEGIAIFAMNDGSTLTLLFDNENLGSTRLAVLNAFSSGGACGVFSSGPFELIQQ